MPIIQPPRSRTITDELTMTAVQTAALGNQILGTSDYEYITFTPTTLTGLPNATLLFQATGDLTIKDVDADARRGRLGPGRDHDDQLRQWGVDHPVGALCRECRQARGAHAVLRRVNLSRRPRATCSRAIDF